MRGKIFLSIAALSAFMLASLLGGCGSGKKEGAADPISTAARVDNSNCTNACHAGAIDSETGAKIVDEWNASTHATGAVLIDCQSCHGGGSTHFGAGPIPHPNPDEDLVCSSNSCHPALGFPHTPNITPAMLASAIIWDNMSSAGYVTSQNTGKCRTCHNPHNNTVLQENRDWGNSRHGKKDGAAWIHYDFKARANCNRCHTTTGHIKYVTSKDKSAWAAPNSADKTKEVLRCDGCHKDYNFGPDNTRNYGPVTMDYTDNIFTYPDAGISNLCIECHAGRETGDTIKNANQTGTTFRNFSSTGFVNSHYLTAGATIYTKSGYEYTGLIYTDPPAYLHKDIGRAGTGIPNTTSGPCSGCHMTSPSPSDALRGHSHTFRPETSTVCFSCHAGPTFADITAVPETGFLAALAALNVELAVNPFRKMFWADKNPYFFTDATFSTALRSWHSVGGPVTDKTTSGKNNMGAAFNYNLLVHDPGAFAHNSTYVKRLIFDSIDWLDDNILSNNSVVATINGLTGLTAQQKADAIAYLNAGVRP